MVIFFFGDSRLVTIAWPEKTVPIATSLAPQTPKDPINLTDAVSDTLATKLIQSNPNGPQVGSDGSSLVSLADPSSIMNEALGPAAGQFDPDDFIPTIDEKNLTITAPADNQAALAYLGGLQTILQTDLKTHLAQADQPDDVLPKLIAERQVAVQELYALPVPKDLLGIHEETLTIVGTQINIFTALQNYQADPLQALLASKFESQVESDLKSVGDTITAYVTAHNL